MAGSEETAFPAALREHLEGCPDCRMLVEQMQFTRRLIALKRYEQPDPGFEDRSARRIRLALAASQAAKTAEDPAVSPWGPLPVLRWAVLAAALIWIGGHVATRRLEPLPSILADQPSSQRILQPPLVTAPAEPAAPVVSMDLPQVATNRGMSGGVQYGPLPSQPVRFDY